MKLQALGYIGVATSKPDDWGRLATGLLGLQSVDRGGGSQSFRMDDRRQRLIVTQAPREGLGYIGFETSDAESLAACAAELEGHGVAVQAGGRSLAGQRHVADLIVCHDPAGNRIEIFHGAAMSADPFVPGRPISGFVTGALGMGHVVMNVTDVSHLLPFYRDVLGLAVSDYGLTPYPLYFFHLNNRHHSFAMVGSGRNALHHIMLELASLDDVGQGYDLAQLEENRVAYTLGRHANDHVTSFYLHTPSGFFVEYGWGGRRIDPATWQPHETFDGPSLWGHERLYMEPEPRARLRQMRLDAAARGVRVADPCAWRDAVLARG